MLVEEMNENPPIHLIVAAALGKKEQPQRLTWENESFDSMLARWGGQAGAGMR